MIRTLFIVIAVCAMATESSVFNVHRSRRSADTCGVPKIKSGLIVQGQNFTHGSFPWIVALMYTGTRPPTFFCGATLISKTFVISAAHCILQKSSKEKYLARDIVALFGAHDLNDPFEIGRYQLSPKKIYLHDDWSPWTTDYDADVSLLEFETGSIHFNNVVQPICLWNSETDPTVSDGVVSGWGKSEDPTRLHEIVPKLVKVPIQFNEDCLPGEVGLAGISSRRTFCAGLRNGSGVCHGDSGGGIFIKVDGVLYLKGIVSSSLLKDGVCDVSKNAVYTNVLKFQDWIRDMIATKGIAATTIISITTKGGGGNIQSANQSNANLAVSKEVFCTFEVFRDPFASLFSSCKVNQTIDSDDFVLGAPTNTSIDMFDVSQNKETKFFLRQIGEKFPNLKQYYGSVCRLTVVRDFYFKNMRNLQSLHLNHNYITTIEAKAFDDLVSLTFLRLEVNRIETLDEKLFSKMVLLDRLYLAYNKINFLSPTIFNIPSGKLSVVSLTKNVCIDKWYEDSRGNWSQLEADLRTNCTGSL